MKVGADIPNRTAAMCEALFNLNKSFLSLPIDAINGVALSALVTDHYNNLPLDERDGDSVSDHDTTTVEVEGGGGDECAAAAAVANLDDNGVDADEAVLVDDTPVNLDGARSVGMQTVLVGSDPAPAMTELRSLVLGDPIG